MGHNRSWCDVAALYTLHIPGLWNAVRNAAHAPETPPAPVGISVADLLLGAAMHADDSYHHPRARESILRIFVLEDREQAISIGSPLPITAFAQVSRDDLVILSVFALELKLDVEAVLKV